MFDLTIFSFNFFRKHWRLFWWRGRWGGSLVWLKTTTLEFVNTQQMGIYAKVFWTNASTFAFMLTKLVNRYQRIPLYMFVFNLTNDQIQFKPKEYIESYVIKWSRNLCSKWKNTCHHLGSRFNCVVVGCSASRLSPDRVNITKFSIFPPTLSFHLCILV